MTSTSANCTTTAHRAAMAHALAPGVDSGWGCCHWSRPGKIRAVRGARHCIGGVGRIHFAALHSASQKDGQAHQARSSRRLMAALKMTTLRRQCNRGFPAVPKTATCSLCFQAFAPFRAAALPLAGGCSPPSCEPLQVHCCRCWRCGA